MIVWVKKRIFNEFFFLTFKQFRNEFFKLKKSAKKSNEKIPEKSNKNNKNNKLQLYLNIISFLLY